MIHLPFDSHTLVGDVTGAPCNTLLLHGAGRSNRHRFTRLRTALANHQVHTAAFDFLGHGQTGGQLLGSSLAQRTAQAQAMVRAACSPETTPITLIGVSMGGYTAVRLTQTFAVSHLVLLVPAAYAPEAYELPFGPAFSACIRRPRSWQDSHAFERLGQFTGKLLIIAAEADQVIPTGVIQGLYRSAINAQSREVHVVPGSGHKNLFPRQRDFDTALARLLETLK